VSAAWAQRGRQALTVMRLELGRGLSLRRGFWLLLLAFAPAFIIFMHAIEDAGHTHSLEEETIILAVMIQLYYVRCGIFFGCLGLAMRLIRGEVAEKTVHYPLLAPLRREVLLIGKFAAAAVSAIATFGTAVLVSFTLLYAHFEAGRSFVWEGPGLGHLEWYLLVAVLASLGYLAVLLLLSLLFKNPIIPAGVLVVWEGINGFLPVWLKHFSVTFYLKPLFPVELPVRGLDLFMVVAEPTSTWVAVTGLLVFSALALAAACWRVRRLEVSYSTD
jgi:ABC-type transport system involved in multi-copper enzyme maturation permease subunit